MRWENFHRHTDRIIDHYAPMVKAAMSRVLDPATISQAINAAYGSQRPKVAKQAANYRPATLPGTNCHECRYMHVDGTCALVKGHVAADHVCDLFQAEIAEKAVGDAWRALLQNAQRAIDALRALVARIYGDGYLQGAHEAADTSGGQMPPWTATLNIPADHWDNWTPGIGDAAAKVAGGGLATLLRDADVWIKEITDTQVARIGDAIAEGIRQGFPVKQVAAQVDAIVNDAARAYLIAETEYARAMTAAARETYQANNIAMVQWIEQPDACPLCQENHAVSPIPLTAQWPNGDVPVHPRCRCAEAPYIPVPVVRDAP